MEDFILSNKERIKVFKLLSENKSLTFNKIAKLAQMRSNKLSYQLKLMREKDFIEKKEEGYSLTKKAQRLVPYFSQIFKREVGVLPVILGMVRNQDKILLIKRKKMPYKGYWGLFGGKQINGETIAETIEREVFEESGVKARFIKNNGVVYERLKEGGEFKHSFLLIITTLQTDTFQAMEKEEGEVKWFDFKEVLEGKVSKVIPSDLMFLQKYAEQEIEIEQVIMEEQEEEKLILEEKNRKL